MATVRLFRPDLLTNEVDQQEGKPIPNEIPPHFLDKHIPHISSRKAQKRRVRKNDKEAPLQWLITAEEQLGIHKVLIS